MDMSTMSGSSMASAMPSMTPTSSAGMSASTAMSMGGMGGMDMGSGACKISMLWNWDTVDACFLSSSWHITSHGMFGGSCIGVICLVVVLEFLRRAQREYNRFLSHKAITSSNRLLAKTSDTCCAERGQGSETSTEQDKSDTVVFATKLGRQRRVLAGPTVLQQAVRATIHMLQFAVAYFIMLLAMYFNGYIIICIFIGAWIGSFVFGWDQLVLQNADDATEVTGCCG